MSKNNKVPKTYEYKVISNTIAPKDHDFFVEESCSEARSEGWELVEVKREKFTPKENEEVLIVFKREVL
ncbi:MAG: DUF4177 domain-containing protein [Cytophagales bacterium]|nr:MAG: DUF4177 domain-containing protein [Cytophagales bacterium]